MRYDERCSACYLGHEHDERHHWLSIAMMTTWSRVSGPYVPYYAEEVTTGIDIWLQVHTPHLTFSRDEIVAWQNRPIR